MKRMSSVFRGVTAVMLLLFTLSGCAAKSILETAFFTREVTSVSCSVEEYRFTSPEQSLSLEATVFPEDATDKSLIYSSTDRNVCIVDAKGTVIPTGNGTAYVMIVPVTGVGTASCRIDVDFHINTEGVVLGENSLNLTEFGQTVPLSYVVLPADATDPSVIWTTGDPSVATVDELGRVTAVGNGQTLVEVRTSEGDFSAACTVNVNVFIDIEDVEFDIREFVFSEPEDELLLTPQFVPSNTTEKGLKWSSTNEKVATVSSDGTVTAIGNGKTKIEALSSNGKKIARCSVTVDLPVNVTGIRVTGDSYQLEGEGQNYQIIATVLPTTADNKKLNYVSSDENIASVSSKGVVTSVGIGECRITVTTEEGNFSQEFLITVTKKTVRVSGVSIKKSRYTFENKNETYQINATVVPSNAENTRLIYTTGDPDIVTVDENGLVTAVGYGITYVAVKSEDGGYSETFYAVFNKPVEAERGDPFMSKVISDGEVRGIWVSTVSNIDFPSKAGLTEKELKKELDTILDNVKENGFNTVFFQVRPKSDALYESSIFPSSDVVVENQGDRLPFDILAYAIEGAHKRGLELHAWLNPYRISQKNGAGQDLSKLSPMNPARLHPEWVVKHSDGAMYYNPAIPEVRKLILDGIEEILKGYNVDGIHFDDYFYPSGSSSSFDDSKEFELYGNGMSLADWRRSNVDTLILAVNNLIKSVKPSVKFGVSPGGIWAMASHNKNGVEGLNKTGQTYFDLYCDSRKWVLNEWVDYICPQIYWNIDHSLAPFKNIAAWWSELCSGTSTQLYIGIAAYRGDENGFGQSEFENELAYLKTLKKCNGTVFFTYNSFIHNYGSITDVVRNQWGISEPENVPPVEIKPASDELVLFNSKQSVENSYKSAFVLGVSDPNSPLTVNGTEIERTASGYFAYFATDLKVGENRLKFVHKGKTVEYIITRKEPEKDSDYMENFGFVNGSFTPKFDYASVSGSTLTFSCNATAGARVWVTLGDYTLELKTSAEKASGGKYRIGWYEGVLTLPQTEGNLLLGSPVFHAEMDGKTAEKALTNSVEVINDPSSYIVTIVKDKCDLIPNLSNDPDEYYFGTAGVYDTVVSKAKGYARLSSGYYIGTSDIERVSSLSSLPLAVSGSVSITDGGDYTHVIIPLTSHSNHVVWQYDDRTEIILYHIADPDSVAVSLKGGEKLFREASAKKIDDSTVKITLTYLKEFHIFGYYCSFDGDRLVVHYRNPATVSEGSKPLTGIRISIDPGHSDSRGALGPWGTKKAYESEFNLTLSEKVADRLTALGAVVKLSHRGEGEKNLDTLIKEFRSWNPDLNISIHFNSISSDINPNGIRGTETYYSFGQSKLLAGIMLDTFTEMTGIYKRSAKPGYYKVSRFTDFPSILFETAFICNPEEYEWFMTEGNMDVAAAAITAGIVAYFTTVSES